MTLLASPYLTVCSAQMKLIHRDKTMFYYYYITLSLIFMLAPSNLQTNCSSIPESSFVVKLINHYVIGMTNEGKGGSEFLGSDREVSCVV